MNTDFKNFEIKQQHCIDNVILSVCLWSEIVGQMYHHVKTRSIIVLNDIHSILWFFMVVVVAILSGNMLNKLPDYWTNP